MMKESRSPPITEYSGELVWTGYGDGTLTVAPARCPGDVSWSWKPSRRMNLEGVTAILYMPSPVDATVVGFTSGMVRVFRECGVGTAYREAVAYAAHNRRIHQIIVSRPHTRRIITCSADSFVMEWEVGGSGDGDTFLRRIRIYEGCTDEVRAVAIPPRPAGLLVAVCTDFTIRVWERHTKAALAVYSCDVSRRTTQDEVGRILIHTLDLLSDARSPVDVDRHAVAASFRTMRREVVAPSDDDKKGWVVLRGGEHWNVDNHSMNYYTEQQSADNVKAIVISHDDTEGVNTAEDPDPVTAPPTVRGLIPPPASSNVYSPTPEPLRIMHVQSPDRTIPRYPYVPSASPDRGRHPNCKTITTRPTQRLKCLVQCLLGPNSRATLHRYWSKWRRWEESTERRTIEVHMQPLDPGRMTLFIDMGLISGGTLLEEIPQGIDVVAWVPPSALLDGAVAVQHLRDVDVYRKITQCIVRDPHTYARAPRVCLPGLDLRRAVFLETSTRLAASIDARRTVVFPLDLDLPQEQLWVNLAEMLREVAYADADAATVLSVARTVSHRTEYVPMHGTVDVIYLL